MYLKRPTGPQTCFKVFGSPSTPGPGNWAFEYEAKDAVRLWSAIPKDADIVVTHTPPKGLCDRATKDDRSGCPALLQRLAIVRPSLHVCGHIHEARGIERVHWSSPHNDSLVKGVEHWHDPGRGNKKLSLLDLTSKAAHSLSSSVLATRQIQSYSLQCSEEDQLGFSMPGIGVLQPDQENPNSTTSLIGGALQESEAYGRIADSGVVEHRRGVAVPRAALRGDSGRQSRSSRYEETAVINAAFLGPRINGKTTGINKAIVVDIDLPVWKEDDGDDVQ